MVHIFKLMRLCVILYATTGFFVANTSFAQSNNVAKLQEEIDALRIEIEKLKLETADAVTNSRLNELEVAMEDAQDKIGSRALAHAFEGIKLDIGGFLHTAYTIVDAEDDSQGSFNRQNFELLIGAELTDSWSAFIAGGFLRESNDPFAIGTRTSPQFDTNNRNPLIIGWANYEANDLINIRLGRMITPHGIINIEHFPATLYDPEQPQFLRPFGGNTIFPNFSTGIQLHGEYFGDSVNFEYATYLVNTPGVGDIQANTEEIVGGRAALGLFENSVKLGINFSDSYRGTTDSYNTMQGLDLLITLGEFQIKSEYYETEEDSGGDREAYYIQPILHAADRWSLFYRFDFLAAGTVYGESTENVFGINYAPSYNIRLRLTYTAKEFEGGYTDSSLSTPIDDTEADVIQFSGTFSF